MVDRLNVAIDRMRINGPGLRLSGDADVAEAVGNGSPVSELARQWLGPDAVPVRVVLLDKSPRSNWGVGWHQDRTIAVQARVDTPGFGPWTIKNDVPHVAPPFALLARMMTLRIHLDDVAAENAPLIVAPGTHRIGRVAEGDITAVVARHGAITCLARAGDVWLYATPILHMSRPAERPCRRRVLQVDYCATPLPAGLAWAGI